MVTIYRDEDADLSVLDGATISVIGYGNQGRAQSLNLRDSGLNVIVGCPPDSYRDRAAEDGFEVLGVAEAAERGDILLVLIPDELQASVYQESLLPGLREGNALGFASGYNIYFKHIAPPAFVDVLMVAPRMIGSAVRSRFVKGIGFPCLLAVEQDATGTALQRALAIARGTGGTRAGAFASSFEEEMLLDLFSEQWLWAGINRLCMLYYETLVAAGCTPDTIATEMYLSGEMVEIAEAMLTEGFFKQLDLHSQTSQYGQLTRAASVLGPEAETRARETLAAIRDGAFAEEWKKEQERGKPRLTELKRQVFEHPLNKIEDRLRRSQSDA